MQLFHTSSPSSVSSLLFGQTSYRMSKAILKLTGLADKVRAFAKHCGV